MGPASDGLRYALLRICCAGDLDIQFSGENQESSKLVDIIWYNMIYNVYKTNDDLVVSKMIRSPIGMGMMIPTSSGWSPRNQSSRRRKGLEKIMMVYEQKW